MKRLVTTVSVLTLVTVFAGGCSKKHHNRDGDSVTRPNPVWGVGQVSVAEGASVVVTLGVDEIAEVATVFTLSSDDTTRVTLPATVIVPANTSSVPVTITTHADADLVNTLVLIHATGEFNTDTMGVVMTEIPAPTVGGALGPVTIGANRAMIVDAGADGIWSTADDRLAVVTGVGSDTPSFLDVTIGAVTPGPQALPVLTGVSDTALVMTNGPDLTLGTSDDTLVQVGGLSTATPAVSASIVVGRMEASEGRRPVMVGPTAVFLTRGADLLTNGDDELAMIGGVGSAALSLTTFSTPGVAFEAPSLVATMSASSLAIHISGPDLSLGTLDDVVEVIIGIGGVPSVGFSTPAHFSDGRMGVPVVVNSTTLAVIGTGVDLVLGTADDKVAVIRDILTVPISTNFTVGAIQTDPDAVSVVTPGDAWVVPLLGADLLDFSADDEVAVFVNVSTTPLAAPTVLAAARAVPGAKGRLLVLADTVVVREASGTDGALGTMDDGLAVLSALTGAGATTTVATGALQPFAPLLETSTSVVLAGEGDDETSGNADDRVIEVTGVGTTNTVASNFPGSFRLSGPGALVPDGGGFVLLARTAGPDGAPGSPDDLLSTAFLP